MDVFLKRQDVRRRRQWGQKLRQIERALLSMLIMVVSLAAVYGLYRLVYMGSAFEIERVVVEGSWNKLSGDEIAVRSGVKAGDNLFWISVDDVHERLRNVPWIEEVAVRRRLPDTLHIYVEEFTPVAILAANAFYFVDDDGTLIKEVDAGEGMDLPVLSGLSVTGTGEIGKDDSKRLKDMLSILDVFGRSRFGREDGIAELNYDDVRGYSIVTRNNPIRVLLGKRDLAERVRQVDRMIGAMTADMPPIRYMIANENGRVIVRYRPS